MRTFYEVLSNGNGEKKMKSSHSLETEGPRETDLAEHDNELCPHRGVVL